MLIGTVCAGLRYDRETTTYKGDSVKEQQTGSFPLGLNHFTHPVSDQCLVPIDQIKILTNGSYLVTVRLLH